MLHTIMVDPVIMSAYKQLSEEKQEKKKGLSAFDKKRSPFFTFWPYE